MAPASSTQGGRRDWLAALAAGCYDEGKRCAETLFFDYHRQHRVDIRVLG